MRAALAPAAILVLCGCGQTSGSAAPTPTPAGLSVTSPDLGGGFPAALTCDGTDQAPRVQWTGLPASSRQVSLEMTDSDAPGGTFTHCNSKAARRTSGFIFF